MNCQHQPADNCPDHGPAVSGLAQAAAPLVYSSGVWGHDHLVAAPPSPPAAGDFNVAWEPVVVLFTSTDAVTRITELAHGRHIRQRGGSIIPGNSECAEAPGAHGGEEDGHDHASKSPAEKGSDHKHIEAEAVKLSQAAQSNVGLQMAKVERRPFERTITKSSTSSGAPRGTARPG